MKLTGGTFLQGRQETYNDLPLTSGLLLFGQEELGKVLNFSRCWFGGNTFAAVMSVSMPR